MQQDNLVSLSLIYYDMQINKYKKYYNKNNKLMLFYNENNQPVFKLENDTKLLMKGDYNFIGAFLKTTNQFQWGWDILFVNSTEKKFMKNNTYYIRKIINYIFDLNIDAKNVEELIFYNDIKNMFLHNMFNIENPIQLEQLLAITLNVTKSDLIYKIDNVDKNYTEFYILRNVEIL
jgi:hypothetical protein